MKVQRLACALIFAIVVAMIGTNGAESATAHERTAEIQVPAPIWGVTLDCGYRPRVDGAPGLAQLNAKLPLIVDSLAHLAKKPTVRVVFDKDANPADYIPALRKLRSVSYIMGELLDSSHLHQFNTSQYRARAENYFDTLGKLVDIWEIGNEVNGSWTGNRATVAASIAAAFDEARTRGLTTAITFFLDNTEPPANHMFPWISTYLASRVKTGVNYALVSYYNSPTGTNWTPIYTRLASIFRNARVGFGEMGGSDTYRSRMAAIQHLYGLIVPVSTYIGGYFYWYYCTDSVPYGGNRWQLINQKIAHGPERLP